MHHQSNQNKDYGAQYLLPQHYAMCKNELFCRFKMPKHFANPPISHRAVYFFVMDKKV